MLQGLSPHIVRAAEANEALLCDAMRLGVAAGRASRLGAARRDVPAMLAAIEGSAGSTWSACALRGGMTSSRSMPAISPARRPG